MSEDKVVMKRYKTFVDEYEISITNAELIKYSKKIEKLNKLWYREVKSSNSIIIGASPIIRVNDARIRKLVANTQAVINKYASEISDIMIELDHMATDKNDADEELLEIIKLIADCFSVLHMEYLLIFEKSENIVKNKIEQSVRNIYVKWNKKYKTLPTKQLLDIENEIEEIKKKLEETRKQEKDTIKKIKIYSPQSVEQSNVKLHESIDQNNNVIEELMSKNEELDVNISSIEKILSEYLEEKDRLEGEIKYLKNEHKKEIKQCASEQQSIENELDRLAEQKRNLENERFNLKRNEEFERNKASSSLIFKNKHLALADSIAVSIFEIDGRIESINKQIENNNLKDKDLKQKLSDLKANIESDMSEKNQLIEKMKQLIDDENDKKRIISNEKRSNLEIIKKKQAKNKQNQKTIKDNRKIVKENYSEVKRLKEVLDDAKAETVKLEEKKNALEEEKNEMIKIIKQHRFEPIKDEINMDDNPIEKSSPMDHTSKRKGIVGLKFVVTGDIKAFHNRADLKIFIEEHGAKLSSSVSKKTDYLLTNTPDSGIATYKKAREFGVNIINEEQFFALVGEENKYNHTFEETNNYIESVAISSKSKIDEHKKIYQDKENPFSLKIFHLSDLHIGLKLFNKDLLEDQKYIFDQIVKYAKSENPDAVVIAGDIYDKAIPSAEAVTLFDDFISSLAGAVPNATIMMISGNHDSAPRVNVFRNILKNRNIYMVGQPPQTKDEYIEKVTMVDSYGNVNFYLLPFVKPSMIKEITGVDEKGNNLTYDEAIHRLVERENIDESERNVLVSHQFYLPVGKNANDIDRMESEIVTVGNIDSVKADVLKPFDYAALGHIHKPMKVGSEFYRYSGTPLACSVSEAEQSKGVIVVEMNEKGNVKTEVLPLNPLRKVRIISGTLSEILKMGCDDYVTIIITDKEDLDVIDMQDRIRHEFPNLLEIRRDIERKIDYNAEFNPDEALNPYELCNAFLPDLTDEEKELLRDVINDVNNA